MYFSYKMTATEMYAFQLLLAASDLEGAQGSHQEGSPHHVHVFDHTYDLCQPLSHFYQRGKFVCRRYRIIGLPDGSISLEYYLIL